MFERVGEGADGVREEAGERKESKVNGESTERKEGGRVRDSLRGKMQKRKRKPSSLFTPLPETN